MRQKKMKDRKNIHLRYKTFGLLWYFDYFYIIKIYTVYYGITIVRIM